MNNKTTLMTEGSITKNILFFSIPLILGNLLQQLYSTVDSIIVGNFVGSDIGIDSYGGRHDFIGTAFALDEHTGRSIFHHLQSEIY